MVTIGMLDMFWHERYTNLNFFYLLLFQKHDLLANLPSIHVDGQVCENCVAGKQRRDKFETGKAMSAAGVFELVHSDLCGTMPTTNLGGAKYFLTFIDDYSDMGLSF